MLCENGGSISWRMFRIDDSVWAFVLFTAFFSVFRFFHMRTVSFKEIGMESWLLMEWNVDSILMLIFVILDVIQLSTLVVIV